MHVKALALRFDRRQSANSRALKTFVLLCTVWAFVRPPKYSFWSGRTARKSVLTSRKKSQRFHIHEKDKQGACPC
jgi:hypothetical protein